LHSIPQELNGFRPGFVDQRKASAQGVFRGSEYFSMEAAIIPQVLPDEKIFDSPLAKLLRTLNKVPMRKPEIEVSGVSG